MAKAASRPPLPPARARALAALEAILDHGIPLQAALDRELATGLDEADRGLLTELVYGFCRMGRRMEGLLGFFCPRPAGLPAPLRRIMTLAALEITILSRIPAYASVNWAAGAARARFGARLAGVANGALRAVARLGEEAARPDFYRDRLPDETRFLEVWHGKPAWLIRRLFATLPRDEALAWLETFNRTPTAGFRINAARPEAGALLEELEKTAVARAGFALAFAPSGVPASARGTPIEMLLAQGRLSRQGFGAQEALEWAIRAGLGREAPIWDACAGRGGKSALLMERGLEVALASDVHAARLGGLRREMERLGLPCPPLALADAARPACRLPACDILIDAPCSGLGTLARRPDIAFHRTEADLAALEALQARIGASLASRLAPGRRLVWMTCTISRAENGDQARALAKNHGLALEGEFSTPPDSPGNEYFYAAMLRRPA